ncbi:hypothetical protein QAD02_003332 [Eretmocerus hayati]|uniref:Uncharacterized protein n=1 Tax=Eretmocerus hayati TaxID=131215 RepID=A0ACC2NMH6_9HYME|nr:hypothetical protein QAD02_003332 [Eretmocerus hayati]
MTTLYSFCYQLPRLMSLLSILSECQPIMLHMFLMNPEVSLESNQTSEPIHHPPANTSHEWDSILFFSHHLLHTCEFVETMDISTDVSDEECLLAEFVNHSNELQVGFSSWLSDVDQKHLAEIIAEERLVVIDWPIHLAVEPAAIMRKKMHDAKYKKKVVKVLAQGREYNQIILRSSLNS